MGRLLIFAAVILVVFGVLALWGLFLKNRENAAKAGLKGSKQHIKELEASDSAKTTALREIREIALSNEAVMGDPTWSLIVNKADEVLEQEK